MKLTIELVPKTTWYINLRKELSKSDWDFLRKLTYKKANHTCEICGKKDEINPIECHEIWKFDDVNRIQILEKLIALCRNCHQVKHIGLAQATGNYEKAFNHLMLVNNMSFKEAEHYIGECFQIWDERSRFSYKVNIDWVKQFVKVKNHM